MMNVLDDRPVAIQKAGGAQIPVQCGSRHHGIKNIMKANSDDMRFAAVVIAGDALCS